MNAETLEPLEKKPPDELAGWWRYWSGAARSLRAEAELADLGAARYARQLEERGQPRFTEPGEGGA